MSDRVAVMAGGNLVQIGSPQDLYERPRDGFVADFIGKMNFVAGHIVGVEADETIVKAATGALFRVKGGQSSVKQSQPVQLAFRPERARLMTKEEARPDAIGGTVAASVFVGAHHMYVVDIGHARQVHIQADTSATTRFSTGDEVDILPDLAHLAAFPQAEAR